MSVKVLKIGTQTSGFEGHAGRRGRVGGSLPRGGTSRILTPEEQARRTEYNHQRRVVGSQRAAENRETYEDRMHLVGVFGNDGASDMYRAKHLWERLTDDKIRQTLATFSNKAFGGEFNVGSKTFHIGDLSYTIGRGILDPNEEVLVAKGFITDSDNISGAVFHIRMFKNGIMEMQSYTSAHKLLFPGANDDIAQEYTDELSRQFMDRVKTEAARSGFITYGAGYGVDQSDEAVWTLGSRPARQLAQPSQPRPEPFTVPEPEHTTPQTVGDYIGTPTSTPHAPLTRPERTNFHNDNKENFQWLENVHSGTRDVDEMSDFIDNQVIKTSKKGAAKFIRSSYEFIDPDTGMHSKVTDVNMVGSVVTVSGVIKNRDGLNVGTFKRNLYPDEIHNDYFSLNSMAQGTGFGSKFYRNAERYYKKVGVPKITIFANIDVGGYAWARMGFDFESDSERNNKISGFKTKIEYNLHHTFYTESQTQKIRRRASKIKYAWDIANFRGPNGETWGKDFMLGSNWYAVKYLNPDSKSYKVGEAYYRAKDRERSKKKAAAAG